MKIENESQWNTDDLRAMTAKVMVHEKLDPALYDMVIFKTARRRMYKNENIVAARTSGYRGIQRDYDKTKVVEIYSKDRLIEKNLLDRMVQTTVNDVQQDIHPKFVRQVAEAIRAALIDKYSTKDHVDGYEFAEKLQFRSASKITRSGEIIKLKIQSLESEKARVGRTLEWHMRKLDEQIAALVKKLPADPTPNPPVTWG